MSELNNPYEAAIRWECSFCGAAAGEWCVTRRAGVKAGMLHARRGEALRKIMRDEFFRGREYERNVAIARAQREGSV